jgi:cephalosporin-C deacetylase-like acetyl esterase
VREVCFTGEIYLARPTRVFAYLGVPEHPAGPVPGVVLLHGYGQNASRDWVKYWLARGCAAIALDLNGAGPHGPLPDGGPPLRTLNIFGPFPWDNPRNGWVYHAVADALLGHSLLAAQPGVDPERIAVNGLSWGGFAACLVAGVDARLRAAAAVYGCGFLLEDSFWLQFLPPMDCRRAAQWNALLDPGAFLPGVTCPFLFQVGANDPFFPPDSQRHSWDVCGGDKQAALRPDMNHGDFWRWPHTEVEVNWFLDHHLKGAPAPPRVRLLAETETRLTCAVDAAGPLEGVYLCVTTNTGPWSLRTWTRTRLEVTPARFTVTLPPERPLAAFVSVAARDARGGLGWFSTPFLFRHGADSPDHIELGPARAAPGGVRLTGRKPRGRRILVEGTADWCHWTRLATNDASGIEFETLVPLPTEADFQILRARSWDLVR